MYLWQNQVSGFQGCPDFRGVRSEGFHCISIVYNYLSLIVSAGVWPAKSAWCRQPRPQPSNGIVQDQRSKQPHCDDGSGSPADDWPIGWIPVWSTIIVYVFTHFS